VKLFMNLFFSLSALFDNMVFLISCGFLDGDADAQKRLSLIYSLGNVSCSSLNEVMTLYSLLKKERLMRGLDNVKLDNDLKKNWIVWNNFKKDFKLLFSQHDMNNIEFKDKEEYEKELKMIHENKMAIYQNLIRNTADMIIMFHGLGKMTYFEDGGQGILGFISIVIALYQNWPAKKS